MVATDETTDGHVVTLTSMSFDEMVGTAPVPVLVELWVEGCGPCLAMVPVLEGIAAEHEGRLRVGTVRLDDAPELARRFEIMAVPTLILFTGGKPTARLDGPVTRGAVVEMLRGLVS
jgi:thioredoxin 1